MAAVPSVWQRRTGEQFEAFKALCLQEWTSPIYHFACPLCYCCHRVRHRSDGTFVGICRCEPAGYCADIPLTLADITPLEVNWSRLSRAICRALGLDTKSAALALHTAAQIGSWSADAVPVILSIQTDRFVFRSVLAELGMRLRRRFILLAPTSTHMTVHCDELLDHAKAAFFSLDTIVTLTHNGTLQPTKTPANSSPNSRPAKRQG